MLSASLNPPNKLHCFFPLHLYRGLRIKAAVLAGHLDWSVDSTTGHLVLSKKAQASMGKLLSRASLGNVSMHWTPMRN